MCTLKQHHASWFFSLSKTKVFVIILYSSYLSQYYVDDNTYKDDPAFCNFWCQLMHSSQAKMLESLKPRMTTPKVVHCADDSFH